MVRFMVGTNRQKANVQAIQIYEDRRSEANVQGLRDGTFETIETSLVLLRPSPTGSLGCGDTLGC